MSRNHVASRSRKSFACLTGTAILLGLATSARGQEAATDGDPPAGTAEVRRIFETFKGRGELADGTEPTPAEAAVARLETPEDLRVELIAAEPEIRQPLHISFDHRGRMWVVQYRQYPFPAGLKVVRYDQHLRAVFDRVPDPPPNHVAGRDVISVLEDSDCDGRYESVRDVITGLNIATSVAVGQGGVWVMNPPYLLRYPDENDDAVPDGDPEVHLSGFGLEDTHSVANSIRFSPDGWLYGANGSTTTAVVRSGGSSPTAFQGQCIWRYHPPTQRFEIFAEGGGNTFSLEVDRYGRVFSGTNNGDTRGMYYPQGSYGKKNWGKHGPLTNPYAFGYFDHMRFEGDGRRFSQTFAIYDADVFPSRFRGAIISVNPLQNVVWASRLQRDTSTFRTADFETAIATDDGWFRPVDVEQAPDGGLYFADWYDSRLTHVDPRDNWHKSSGRIYRLGAAERHTDAGDAAGPVQCPTNFDLRQLPVDALLQLLDDSNRWFRLAAVEELVRRDPPGLVPRLIELVDAEDPRALEALWVAARLGGLDSGVARRFLQHANPHVRSWTIRLIVDAGDFDASLVPAAAEMARGESEPQVRAQLISSVRRMPAEQALPILDPLLRRDADADDLHIPLLLWWAVEQQCRNDLDAAIGLFDDSSLWSARIVEETILSRLMRRAATIGGEEGYGVCERLLTQAPSSSGSEALLRGFDEAFAGQSLAAVAQRLTDRIKGLRADDSLESLLLGIGTGNADDIGRAINIIQDPDRLPSTRVRLVEALGVSDDSRVLAALLSAVRSETMPVVQLALLDALNRFEHPAVADQLVAAFERTMVEGTGVRPVAIRLLTSRPAWAQRLVKAIDRLFIPFEMVPIDAVRQMASYNDPDLQADIERIWGRINPSSKAIRETHQRVADVLVQQRGDRHAGAKLFKEHCQTCHKLFGTGGEVGPDLTGYERKNRDFLTLAVVDPSAAVREEFTAYQLLTTDGLAVSGLLVDQNERAVELRTVEGRLLRFQREDIELLQASHASLMPTGLLDKLSDQQIADLFAYLQAESP